MVSVTDEAKGMIEASAATLNMVRPHSSLGYGTPAAFAAKVEKTKRNERPSDRAGALRVSGPPRPGPSRSPASQGANQGSDRGDKYQLKWPKKQGRSTSPDFPN